MSRKLITPRLAPVPLGISSSIPLSECRHLQREILDREGSDILSQDLIHFVDIITSVTADCAQTLPSASSGSEVLANTLIVTQDFNFMEFRMFRAKTLIIFPT